MAEPPRGPAAPPATGGKPEPQPGGPGSPSDSASNTSSNTVRPCPICRKPTSWEGNPWRPFCSERCQVQDQAAWADDRYRVPAKEDPPEEEKK